VGDLFTNNDEQDINDAVHKMRDIYATVNLGIGRIEHYFIPVAMANGREHIDDDGEASALTNEWTVHNDALDVFLVLSSWENSAETHGGLSATDGPCDKDDSCGMSGSVVSMDGGWLTIAVALGHEVGHYLGLGHHDNDHNLMYYAAQVWKLTSGQGAIMKLHCFVKSGC
jgi:hypothetical protein